MVIPHSYDPAHSCICRKTAETSPVQKTQVQKQARKGSLMLVHLDSQKLHQRVYMGSSKFSGKTNEKLRGNLTMDWHLIQGHTNSSQGHQDKLWLDRALGLSSELTLLSQGAHFTGTDPCLRNMTGLPYFCNLHGWDASPY